MSAQTLIKRLLYVFLIVIIVTGFRAINLYRKAFTPNIFLEGKTQDYLYIHTGSTFADVLKTIDQKKIVKNKHSFEWTARKKDYPNRVKAGKYKVKNRMSNNELVNALRSGRQEPVQFTFNNIRTLSQLAERVASQIELDSIKLLNLLNSKETQIKYGFNEYTIKCMFIPNTYEFFWNTSEVKFLDRMYQEYNSFWNITRLKKAKNIHMTREQTITLASIINEETDKNDEKAKIAGVYINRLKKGMRLQADPTIVYVVGDFSLQRVLRKHYQINSPYNTYIYYGLPPGPICLPEITSIDAVLNYEDNNYFYFCARPDFSGYHIFARTLEEHNRNARLYRHELNKRKIYR
jgi:UPF0755 protein